MEERYFAVLVDLYIKAMDKLDNSKSMTEHASNQFVVDALEKAIDIIRPFVDIKDE